MSTRAEVEAALQKAEARWHAASNDLALAQAERTKANAKWDQLIADRRKTVTDRRKSGAVWNGPFSDRRIAAADRRMLDDGIAALAKKVTDQHGTYLARSKADADCAAAKARLDAASTERDRAVAALDALDRADRATE
jgi:hypothetical protein